jgi:hypothetical protein
MLWLRHGCNIAGLYGDDGEMQCGRCLIDFKRNSIDSIVAKWEAIGRAKIAEAEAGGGI